MNKILIVDNDGVSRGELAETLGGYEVLEASSGEAALDLIRRVREIGLVILDVRLSDIDGIRALDAIKKIDPLIYVVVTASCASKNVIIDALRNHADDFIQKPIDHERILRVVEEALDRLDTETSGDACGIDAKIRRIENYMARNWFKKVTLSDVAALVSLSPKYLSRIFKERKRQNFGRFKAAIKVNRAKEFLDKDVCSIDEISRRLGYENTESFAKQFKRVTRRTPSEYRTLCRGKKSD